MRASTGSAPNLPAGRVPLGRSARVTRPLGSADAGIERYDAEAYEMNQRHPLGNRCDSRGPLRGLAPLLDGISGTTIGRLYVADLGLEPLAMNDGSTPTHALTSPSPAIDVVPPDAASTPADQRGAPAGSRYHSRWEQGRALGPAR